MNVLGLLQNWAFVQILSHNLCAMAASSTVLLQAGWFFLLLLDLQAGPSKPGQPPLLLEVCRLILNPAEKEKSRLQRSNLGAL